MAERHAPSSRVALAGIVAAALCLRIAIIGIGPLLEPLRHFGAAIAAVTAIPLAHALGGWRQALAVTAVPLIVAIPLWRISRAGEVPRPLPRASLRPPVRTSVALALVFGLQSICFTGTIAWVAPLFSAHGLGDSAAGATPALLALLTVPLSLFVPGLSDGKDRRRWILASAALLAGATFGLAFAPTAAPWLWLVLFAMADGAVFPLALTLPLDVAPDSDAAGALYTWTLGLGFGLSAFGPVLVGALRDLSGGFELPLAVLACCALTCGLLAQRVHPHYGRHAVVASP